LIRAEYLLLLLLIVAGLTYQDYGMGTDESRQLHLGNEAWDYMFKGDAGDAYLKNADRDYGVAFELALTGLVRASGRTEFRDVILLRHFATHLFFLLGGWCLVLLVRRSGGSEILAIAALLMYVLSPRLYGHSFFNSKDLPFFSMSVICFYTWFVAFDEYDWRSFAAHGLASALLVNTRIMGVQLVAFTLLLLTVHLLIDRERRRQTAAFIGVYGIVFLSVLVATWPLLWTQPLEHFRDAFTTMSRFPRWKGTVLFGGEHFPAGEVPWYYALRWVGMTTPVLYQVLFLTGLFFLVPTLAREKWAALKNPRTHTVVMCFFFAVAPLIAVVVFRSVIYSGWRQLYFVYAGVLVLMVFGLQGLGRAVSGKGAFPKALVAVPVILQFALTAGVMYVNHPFNNVYFNLAIPRQEWALRKNFPLDYFGTSYFQGFKYLLDRFPDKQEIRVHPVNESPGFQNWRFLASPSRNRIKIVPSAEAADFVLTDYRGHQLMRRDLPEFHSLWVHGNRILSIFGPRPADAPKAGETPE
jgi:hypothetical protein